VNECTSGAPWQIVNAPTTNHQETIDAEQQWRPWRTLVPLRNSCLQ